jgi:hypothetical protein
MKLTDQLYVPWISGFSFSVVFHFGGFELYKGSYKQPNQNNQVLSY